jgi:hypothetical protein
MMNPYAYRREEERYETETAARISHERGELPGDKRRGLYSREVLPSGCILFCPTTFNLQLVGMPPTVTRRVLGDANVVPYWAGSATRSVRPKSHLDRSPPDPGSARRL